LHSGARPGRLNQPFLTTHPDVSPRGATQCPGDHREIGRHAVVQRGTVVKRFGWLAAMLALALFAAACSRSGSTGAPPASNTNPSTTAATAGPGDFGTLKKVCGPGTQTTSPDQGVTPDSIEIATSSDPGFAGRRGLNQEIFDAGEVFTKWCNAAGGINGRKIKLDEYDAALFNFDAQIKKACATAFYLVGNGNVFDNNPGQRDRLSCLLPEIPTYMVTLEGRDSDLTVQPVPNKSDQIAVGPFNFVAKKFPDAIKSVVTLTGNVSATELVDAQSTEAARTLGWTVKANLQYSALGEPTWVPVAQKIKDQGAKGLLYTGEPQNLALLMKALQQINYPLDFVLAASNHYDQNLITGGGSAIHNIYMTIGFVPFEDAGKNPATQQYLDLFAKYKPKGKSHAALGLQTWSAWLLFAEAADKCGADVTRKCVYDNSLTFTDWTGGGLNAPQNVKDQSSGNCGIILEATPSGFVEPAGFEPNNGFFKCDPSGVLTLHGDYSSYGKGVKLSDVGKTLADLK
jgi:ABC-type branched-subunit amino acid transport system substrate-binding protein